MKTLVAIQGAVRTALDQAVRDGDIDADSSWEEIRECLRQSVEPNLDWPPALVDAEILTVALDMRPFCPNLLARRQESLPVNYSGPLELV